MSTSLVLWRPPAGRCRRWFCLRRCPTVVVALLLLATLTPTGTDAATVTGKVVDRQTRQRVKHFLVLPGTKGAKSVYWARRDGQTGLDGRFQLDLKHRDVVRIEAEGYEPAESGDIDSGKDSVTIDFELTRGQDFDGVVLMPDGRPAAGARVAVGISGSQIGITNGEIDRQSTAAQQGTDASGRFHFPPQAAGFWLAISHPSGFVLFRPTPHSLHRTINLDPWRAFDGIYRAGGKPVANIPITIRGLAYVQANFGPRVASTYDTLTGPDGRFVFERVVAFRSSIGRRVDYTPESGYQMHPQTSGMTSWCEANSIFPSGKTVQLDLGHPGGSVIGRLRPPAGYKKPFPWAFLLLSADPVGAEGNVRNPTFKALVNQDGTYRFDDMPAGDYMLHCSVEKLAIESLFLPDIFFTVRLPEGPQTARPLDLGPQTLQKN